MRLLHIILTIALVVMVLGPGATVLAQDDGESSCREFAKEVIAGLGTNCADQDGNTVCYGSSELDRMFVDDAITDDVFSELGDRAELTWLARVSAMPFNLEDEEWGVSSFTPRANLHNALDARMTYILFGEAELENRVQPDEALLSTTFTTVETIADAPVFRHANTTSKQLGTIASGTLVEIDGVSADEAWLRVLYNDGETNYTGWIERAAVEADADISALPTIDHDTMTPMQDFFLRNSFENPCKEGVAPGLLVQAPEDTQVDIRVNDIDIRLDSTIILRILPPGDLIQLIVLDGLAIVFPDTTTELIVPPGHYTTSCLTPPGDYGGLDRVDNDQIVACPFDPVLPLDAADVQALNLLTLLPSNILSYRIIIPIIIIGSGVGGVIVIIQLPLPAIRPVCRICEAGLLSDEICERFQCPVP